MKYLSLSISGTPIEAPRGVPTGGMDTGQKIIQMGLNFLFAGGIIIAVIIVIYSGIQWILSGGEKEQIQQARARLTYSIIGLVVITAAFTIVRLIITILGGKPSLFPLGPS